MKKIFLLAFAAILALGASTSCKKDQDPVYYTVNFDSAGGSAVTSQQIEDGHLVNRPADPTREGYDFVNWLYNGNVWDFAQNVVTRHLTLRASWSAIDDGGVEELTGLVDEADALDEADYTADSWAALQEALTAAQAVLDDPAATPAQVTEALDNLQAAIDSLVESVDKGDLETAVEVASAAKESDYTPAGWITLQAALTVARNVVENPEATQQQIDDALANLQVAYDNQIPDKSDLEEAIAAADELSAGNYPAVAWNAFREVLAAAIEVNENADATQEDVDAALTNLLAAIDTITEEFDPNQGGNTGGNNPVTIDKSALNTRIAAVSGYVEADYTADSWTGFEAALNEAKAIAANSNASQAMVNGALDRLNHSVTLLQHVTINDPNSDPETDKSALGQFIEDSNALVETDYTGDSWAVLQQALANAVEFYENPDSSQVQINLAYTDLQAAVNNLEHNYEPDGTVIDLVNQLISLVGSLPTADAIRGNIILAAATTPVAILADTVRDTLMPLLHGVDSSLFVDDDVFLELDNVLRALGLDNLV